MACDCRRQCMEESCLSIDNGFKCTDSGKFHSRDNMRNNEEGESAYLSSDDSDCDNDDAGIFI